MKAEKVRRDRTYLLNMIQSNALEHSCAIKDVRKRFWHVKHQGSAANDDDVFQKSRRESAPSRPINIRGAKPEGLQALLRECFLKKVAY